MRLFIAIITLIISASVAVSAEAQITVNGMVIDREANEPLPGASVMVKGPDGKIKKFTSSKADGGFAIELASVEGCRLEVAMMNFPSSQFLLTAPHFLSPSAWSREQPCSKR